MERNVCMCVCWEGVKVGWLEEIRVAHTHL